ncbi:Tyrosine-protein phosphatase 69D [Eumeta japonica]|uniref:Tyrosine-protein phosphatase 69D n=1 Tax=Eumeta variegata TaxID=151549 RepID=A0A4C2A7Y7_EUMVA|nr:Tyrosine-protein phosphatase 69D [Eumeta japonica]
MESTINDFWRMIWEQHLEIIVMLTNLEEYNKTKCAKYWPEKLDLKPYGDINVKFILKKSGDYLVRTLDIFKRNSLNEDEEESRQITQYHYLVWKDFMAPEHPQALIKFIRHINVVYSVQRGPILVHCSAGVDRTGTLVALDSLLQQLEEEDQVSIFNTVCDLRHQRNFLVQSLKQYIFLYRALLDTAHLGNTEINAIGLSNTIELLKIKPDDGREKCKLEIEFEKLQTINDETNKSCSVGDTEQNALKNRSELVIPYDQTPRACDRIRTCDLVTVGQEFYPLSHRGARNNMGMKIIGSIDFKQKLINLDGVPIKLQIWDTAGQERFRTLTTAYYRGAMGILLMYDVTNLESYNNLSYWLRNIQENASPDVVKVLAGNKCECSATQRMVDKERGEKGENFDNDDKPQEKKSPGSNGLATFSLASLSEANRCSC